MSGIMEYKCPACGGAMEFDSKLQKMKCPYCDTEMDVEEFQKLQGEEIGSAGAADEEWQAASDGQWKEGETDGMRIYACESCGGEIVADESTAAANCPFCGNKIVIKGQFAGDLRPDYIIPFKLDKKDAKNAYLKHLSGKPFLPKVFRDQNHIDEIKGVYVPFWLFDADVDADIEYNAVKTRIWESGDTEYTEHSYYKAERGGKVSFQRIPTDGSKKMDDTLMESIEPYKFEEAVHFEPAYLAGYMADRYDVAMEERMQRAKERIKSSAENAFKDTVTGYSSVNVEKSQVAMSGVKYLYALYPVWLLNTTWNGEKFTFAMNGQTGRMVGDLPLDKSAFWRFVATRGIAIGAVLYALMWIFVAL